MEAPLTVGPPSTASGTVLFTFTVTVEVPVTLDTCVTAVMVAWVLAVTCGAVNRPAIQMLPILRVQFTVVVPAPFAVAMHWLFWRGCMALGEHVTVMAVTGVTVMVVVPTCVVSWDEAALIETVVLVFTAGAVNKPLVSMVPSLAP